MRNIHIYIYSIIVNCSILTTMSIPINSIYINLSTNSIHLCYVVTLIYSKVYETILLKYIV